jgi:hypothetical protein
MGPSGEALIALSAGDQGINRHKLARPEALHLGADFKDGTGAFMSDHPGELDGLRPDASGPEVMEIGAANPYGFNAQQDVLRVFDPGRRGLPDFQPPEARQERSFHGESSATV